MMTQIAVMTGEIWLTLDKTPRTMGVEELFRTLEQKGQSRDLIHMALGWLLYQGHVQWIPTKDGGGLLIKESHNQEDEHHEQSNQNHTAASLS